MLFEFTGSREAMHPIGCHYALALSFPSSMNWHETMSSLQQASDLDLLRLRTAIDHLLMQPQRILAVRRELQLDHEVDFWNLRENRLRRAPDRCEQGTTTATTGPAASFRLRAR